MSIVITDPQKEKVVEKDGSKIYYNMPSRSTLLDCFYQVLGKDFDLAKMDIEKMHMADVMSIMNNVCSQAVCRFEDVKDENGKQLEYSQELVEYLPLDVTTQIFNEVMSFLARTFGVANLKSVTKNIKKNSSIEGKKKTTTPTKS